MHYGDTLGTTEPVNRELVDELRDRIGFLERQLENEQRAHAELRRLLAGALERIPELEPAKLREPQEAPQDADDVPEGPGGQETPGGREEATEHRSWWRRWFG